MNKNLHNQSGIALMMVLTAIVLLTTIMLSFSLDTAVNKIKTYNSEDKAQAKLTAESGLKFALARLRLYKDAYNYVQANEGVKSIAKPELLNIIWNFPFVYPIPITKGMNKLQKEAIQKFQKSTLLTGGLRLTITNLSNKLNLNALRLSVLAEQDEDDENDGDDSSSSSDKADENFNLETQLLTSLQNAFQKKMENDDEFNSLYSGLEPTDLVDIIKMNVSDKAALEDPGGLANKFSKVPLTPKHTPLSSMSEIYTLPHWDDDIVELIKNEFTVHGAVMVDLNKITDKLLKILVPEISDDEIKEFFEYKNDPEDPKFFNTKDDFKKYIVQVANLMSSEDFDKLMSEFEKNGIKFGPSASLFKVTSVGEKGRASYTLEAYIALPPKPAYNKEKDPEADDGDDDDSDSSSVSTSTTTGSSTSSGDDKENDKDKDDKKPTVFLLNPRVLEVYAK